MGNEVCKQSIKVDKEQDPAVARRRTELFNKYVKPYFNMIYKLTIKYSYSSDNVEENYNEVLVNFFRRIETYDPERSILTWLHICTKRHVYAMEKRRMSREKSNRDMDIDEYGSDGVDIFGFDKEGASTMDVSNYREMYSDDVLSALDELKPTHRDALLLQEAGYSLKEIVEIEYAKGSLKSRNIETIKSRLFLARKFLRKRLTRDGERIYTGADQEDDFYGCD